MSVAVFFHAHPDDEALLTSGTMAKAAAAGHRVVLVVATDGALGLTSSAYGEPSDLAKTRLAEVQASADALGVARVVNLGYADSGLGPVTHRDGTGRTRFADADVDEAADKLVQILREEQADLFTSYDPTGGYGHPDHVQVHKVGAKAADLTGIPVLEATVPRDLLVKGINLAAKVYKFPPEFDIDSYRRAYSAKEQITHRIDVRHQIKAKRASMRAHASQAVADGGADRTLAAFLRIPRPIYDLVFGREWYVNPRHTGPVSHDIFEDIREDLTEEIRQ